MPFSVSRPVPSIRLVTPDLSASSLLDAHFYAPFNSTRPSTKPGIPQHSYMTESIFEAKPHYYVCAD